MQQTWANLFFQHWEVDESMLQSHLPSGLTVDTFRGKAYLGICGLSMKSVRPQGLPALPWLSHFAELNVRTYVRDPEGNPGVYFSHSTATGPSPFWLPRRFSHCRSAMPGCPWGPPMKTSLFPAVASANGIPLDTLGAPFPTPRSRNRGLWNITSWNGTFSSRIATANSTKGGFTIPHTRSRALNPQNGASCRWLGMA